MRALVFGQYGEASGDVHDLLDEAAAALARKRWAAMGAHTQAEAKSYFASSLRRQLALATVRELARHRLNRVDFVGMPRAVVEARMRAGPPAGRGSAPLLDGNAFYGWQAHNLAPTVARRAP